MPLISSQEVTEYKPLTREEAEAWLRSITLGELIDFVIKYDMVEHATPTFSSFDYACIVTEQDVIVTPVEPTITMAVGSLQYRLVLPAFTFEDVVPKAEETFWKDAGLGAVVGSVASVLFTLFIVSLVR